jgi:hypothetical protein
LQRDLAFGGVEGRKQDYSHSDRRLLADGEALLLDLVQSNMVSLFGEVTFAG